ncbi:MAG: TonB-dependent receptor [Chitinophagaceae bacterium]|nr:TonB-dependent receptor [Chitinophagaceae bacterium]
MRVLLFINLVVVFLLASSLHVFAGRYVSVVTGKVTDASGAPLAGATVQIKGTNKGVVTEYDGTFKITVSDNDVLVVSSVGYVTTEVPVAGKTELNIVLQNSKNELDQVVIVGYGTSRAKDLTAPLSVVKSEDLVKRTTATPMDALQGSVAGVQVVSNGAPGNGPTVRIRGVGSLNNEGPLYVVDGMFFDNIDFLNTNDIEDMSILKDASGAAIYGVKAANGVVLITTRKGKLNMKPRVTYNGYIGLQKPNHVLKMANGAEYTAMELAKQTTTDSAHVLLSSSKFGGSDVNPTTNTDWYSEILRKSALMHNHSIDITGGSTNTSYSFGINYLSQDGIMNADNNFSRFNIHAQTEAKVYSWLKVGYNVLVSNSTLLAPNNAAWALAYKASPLYPVFDETSTQTYPKKYTSSTSLGFGNGVFGNPVAAADYYFDKTKAFQVNPVIYAELAFLRNKITFRTQLSQKYVSNVEVNYIPEYYVDAFQYSTDSVSQLTSTQNRYTNYILDNLLTYKDSKAQHHWSVLLGQSSREERWRQTQVKATNVPNDEHYYYVTNGTTSATGYSEDGTDYKSLSFFARATYDYDSKYFLTATYRADGSNKYQTTWGYFPSVGLGWAITNEDFMKNQHLFDFLKARASWGKLGNDAIPANAAYAKALTGNGNSGIFGSTGTSNGAYVPGYIINGLYSNIGWEIVEEWDGGLDFSLLRSRLTGSIDYYHRLTDNLAFNKTLPMTGQPVYGNWGKVLNEGFEFSLNWADKINKDWGYHIGGNLTTIKNTVKDLGGLNNMMNGIQEFPTRIQVGQPLNYFYGYKMIGVYQTQAEVDADPLTAGQNVMAGYLKYAGQDKSGNTLSPDNDRINLGSYLPKITYGINLGFEYKNFDFSALLQGQAGNKILNLNRARRILYSDMNGDAAFVSGLWTGSGSTNQYPSAYATTQGWNYLASSFFVESGSYLRIQNIQLGYNFTLGKAKDAPKMRLYVTADRPVIFTKYSGFTPEITGAANSIQNTGYDEQIYPVTSTYSFGVRIIY